MTFDNARIIRQAELHHGGRVATRSVVTADGEMKHLGLMQPGHYRMVTEAEERFEVLQGHCRVKLEDEQTWQDYQAGDRFTIPAHSHYEIEIEDVLDYVCHQSPEPA